MAAPTILESTKPLLYETGCNEWPYSFAGSCFPVRWKDNLYIVSAFHCYENNKISPEATLYPIPAVPSEFFGFSCTLRAKIDGAKDLKHHDQIALQVSTKLHPISQTSAVEAIDLSNEDNIAKITDHDAVCEAWLRGYLVDNPTHSVDYEKSRIEQQAYLTNGIVSSRKSPFENCSYVKLKTPAPMGMSPNGISGSAVYVSDNHGKVRLAGTVIEFTEEFLVIDPTVLRATLEKENNAWTLSDSFP